MVSYYVNSYHSFSIDDWYDPNKYTRFGSSDKSHRMRRGDVQFTIGGTGIANCEQNEHSKDTVHFLQIWEKVAEPTTEGTIPIHTDFVMGAALIPLQEKFGWVVGARATESNKRKIYIHAPLTKKGQSKVRFDDRDEALNEGDGAFIDGVNAGDRLTVESTGEVEAQVVLLDTA
ncbi:RmlC-like cupin [Daldinia bambusicola]|nr:RmlC-like cupin [Daldinia bambusicola]